MWKRTYAASPQEKSLRFNPVSLRFRPIFFAVLPVWTIRDWQVCKLDWFHYVAKKLDCRIIYNHFLSKKMWIILGWGIHCMKSVRIRSYYGLYFPAFGRNAVFLYKYSVQMRKNTGQNNSKNGHFLRNERNWDNL